MNAQIQCWRCSQAISVHRDMIGQELFCPNCGSKNGVPAAAFESSATQRFAPPPPAGAIPNYLWQSIVVTLLCCLPFGVVAIVYAAQVNTKLIAGDVSGARCFQFREELVHGFVFLRSWRLRRLVPVGNRFCLSGDGRSTVRRRFTWQHVAIVGAGLAGLIILYGFDPRQHAWYPPCPVHWLTGLHCPGCGSLRCIHALMHGDVVSAASYNVLAVVVIAGGILGGLASVIMRCKQGNGRRVRLPGTLIHGFVALILLFAVIRNIPASPFHYLAP